MSASPAAKSVPANGSGLPCRQDRALHYGRCNCRSAHGRGRHWSPSNGRTVVSSPRSARCCGPCTVSRLPALAAEPRRVRSLGDSADRARRRGVHGKPAGPDPGEARAAAAIRPAEQPPARGARGPSCCRSSRNEDFEPDGVPVSADGADVHQALSDGDSIQETEGGAVTPVIERALLADPRCRHARPRHEVAPGARRPAQRLGRDPRSARPCPLQRIAGASFLGPPVRPRTTGPQRARGRTRQLSGSTAIFVSARAVAESLGPGGRPGTQLASQLVHGTRRDRWWSALEKAPAGRQARHIRARHGRAMHRGP